MRLPDSEGLQTEDRPCPFASMISQRRIECQQASRSLVAERESVCCHHRTHWVLCNDLLEHVVSKGQFALRHNSVKTLPFALRMKCVNGIVEGLRKLAADCTDQNDVNGLVTSTLGRFENLESIPLGEIIKAISAHKPRQRSPR